MINKKNIIIAILFFIICLIGYTYSQKDKNEFYFFGIHKETLSFYDKNGFDKERYYKTGYNQQGYDRKGYNNKGYNVRGYNKKGYNEFGFNKNFINKETKKKYNKNGYDYFGYDKEGYNFFGYNEKGYNKEGFGLKGYNKEGYDSEGNSKNKNKIYFYNDSKEDYSDIGYNKYGFHKNGYYHDNKKIFINDEGFLKSKIHQNTGKLYNQFGIDINGYNKQGWRSILSHSSHSNKAYTSLKDIKYDKEGYNYFGWSKKGFHKETKTKYNLKGFNQQGYNLNNKNILGFKREEMEQDHFGKNYRKLIVLNNMKKEVFKINKIKKNDSFKELYCEQFKINSEVNEEFFKIENYYNKTSIFYSYMKFLYPYLSTEDYNLNKADFINYELPYTIKYAHENKKNDFNSIANSILNKKNIPFNELEFEFKEHNSIKNIKIKIKNAHIIFEIIPEAIEGFVRITLSNKENSKDDINFKIYCKFSKQNGASNCKSSSYISLNKEPDNQYIISNEYTYSLEPLPDTNQGGFCGNVTDDFFKEELAKYNHNIINQYNIKTNIENTESFKVRREAFDFCKSKYEVIMTERLKKT
jgi:hypothetical protein